MTETKTGILPKLTPDDRCPCCRRQWLDVAKRGCLICESSRQERLARQTTGGANGKP